MVAGICGGSRSRLEVGTLINPEYVVDFTTGVSYRHLPLGNSPQAGKLMTTEGVTLDSQFERGLPAQGCIAVDMETSAVAEVCEAHGCPWSVFRCIGDRHFDGLLDERIFAATNPDGSGNSGEIERLIASDPESRCKAANSSATTAPTPLVWPLKLLPEHASSSPADSQRLTSPTRLLARGNRNDLSARFDERIAVPLAELLNDAQSRIRKKGSRSVGTKNLRVLLLSSGGSQLGLVKVVMKLTTSPWTGCSTE